MKKILVSLLILGLIAPAMAMEQARLETLNQALEATLNAKPDSIKAVVPEQLYEASFGGQIFYITGDGGYLINGDLFDLRTRVNLTERSRGKGRLAVLADVSQQEMITYRAKGEEKHAITIFTDIDCGYCQRLHRGMDEMNELGITVRYMAFPRSAPGTESFNKSVSVWCAKDRNKAMTDAKLNNRVTSDNCDTNPVGRHQQIGQQIGVTGTPSIVLQDGTLIPGFMPPPQLLEALDEAAKAAR